MSAIVCDPLYTRPSARQASPSPSYTTSLHKTSSAKRARSPDPPPDSQLQSAKRVKAQDAFTFSRDEAKKEKERRRAEREREFREKYTRAFPSWVFHFDCDVLSAEDTHLRDVLESRVVEMGARVDDFFSKDITHLITFNDEESFDNKENHGKSQAAKSASGSLLRSPIKLKGRAVKDTQSPAPEQLVKKALAFDTKIWSTAKLQSVLDRCQEPIARPQNSSISVPNVTTQPNPAPTRERSLTRLLESERIHGTSERDPTQKRHGYIYFSKNSYYVLIEDMRKELAPIAALEYPIMKGRDGREKISWPVLYCHPLARGPFVEYDEKEEKRRQKAEKAEKEREYDRERKRFRMREEAQRRRAQLEAKRRGDLRRSVSMNNLQRRATFPAELQGHDFEIDLADPDTPDCANASGYLASGTYMAASGNSVGITSTTGTTSTAGNSFRNLRLPPTLKGRLQQQVITSRKFMPTPLLGGKENSMGPPLAIPDRPNKFLRKSRSTNTLRLPKREEGTKPGYCESCRAKFEDFKTHISGKRHRKFAEDDSNFVQLDFVLSRVRRRTLQETAAQRLRIPKYEGDTTMTANAPNHVKDDVQWNEWVDSEGD